MPPMPKDKNNNFSWFLPFKPKNWVGLYLAKNISIIYEIFVPKWSKFRLEFFFLKKWNYFFEKNQLFIPKKKIRIIYSKKSWLFFWKNYNLKHYFFWKIIIIFIFLINRNIFFWKIIMFFWENIIILFKNHFLGLKKSLIFTYYPKRSYFWKYHNDFFENLILFILVFKASKLGQDYILT